MAAIQTVVADRPAWDHRKVWATLRRCALRIGRRRVHETMRSLGLTLPASHPGRKAVPRGHVAVAEPNRPIATDLTVIWTRDSGLVPIVITVDCGCRGVLDVTVTDYQTAFDVLVAVERGLLRAFGAPQLVPDGVELRSDHGPQCTGHDAVALARRCGPSRPSPPSAVPPATPSPSAPSRP